MGDVRQVPGVSKHFMLSVREILEEDIPTFSGDESVSFSLKDEDRNSNFGK